jgi:hypothetical protein
MWGAGLPSSPLAAASASAAAGQDRSTASTCLAVTPPPINAASLSVARTAAALRAGGQGSPETSILASTADATDSETCKSQVWGKQWGDKRERWVGEWVGRGEIDIYIYIERE